MRGTLLGQMHRSKPLVVASGIVMIVVLLPSNVRAAPSCQGATGTIVGTTGDDTLMGTRGVDVIVGMGGSDLLIGRAGDDRICGGTGHDTLYGDAGNTEANCTAARGRDRLSGGRGNDGLWGESCFRHRIRDWFFGGPGSDGMLIGGGRDVIDLGPGEEDTLLVTANEPITVDLTRGVVTGGGLERDEIVRGTVENVEMLLSCYRGDHTFIGDNRANRLVGAAGDDVLKGKSGRDVLRGDDATEIDGCPQQGDDRIFGGPGPDRMLGGEGRDRLHGDKGRDFGNGEGGRDVCFSVAEARSCRRKAG